MDFLKISFLRKIEIISLITTIIGLYMLGEKIPLGFVMFTVSVLCQLYIFLKGQNWFLSIQMIILAIFNMWNYFKWIGEVGVS